MSDPRGFVPIWVMAGVCWLIAGAMAVSVDRWIASLFLIIGGLGWLSLAWHVRNEDAYE